MDLSGSFTAPPFLYLVALSHCDGASDSQAPPLGGEYEITGQTSKKYKYGQTSFIPHTSVLDEIAVKRELDK